MYPKIDIYANGEYICSTNQSKTLREAKEKFLNNPTWQGIGGLNTLEEINNVTCVFSKKQ